MNMTLTLKSVATKRSQTRRKIVVEMDAEKFERMAVALGMFNPDFLKAIEQSEKDYKEGRFRKIKSLRELIR